MFNLTKIRENEGITQAELSRLTGISRPDISRLENGKIYPYSGWKKKLAKALDVDPEILFQEVNDNEQNSQKSN